MPTQADLLDLATRAGWTKTRRTTVGGAGARVHFRTPSGKREWFDESGDRCSVGFWFLVNAK